MDWVVGGRTWSSFSQPRSLSPAQRRKPESRRKPPSCQTFPVVRLGIDWLTSLINGYIGLAELAGAAGVSGQACSCWTMLRCLLTCVSLHITGNGWREIKYRIAALKRGNSLWTIVILVVGFFSQYLFCFTLNLSESDTVVLFYRKQFIIFNIGRN